MNVVMMREDSTTRIMVTTQDPYSVRPPEDTPYKPIPPKKPYSVCSS